MTQARFDNDTSLDQTLSVSDDGFWCRHPEVISRTIAGEPVLVPLKQAQIDLQKIYTLNPVGVFLWDELKTKKSRAELVNALFSHYAVSKEQAIIDVNTFLEDLYINNLIINQK